jgi:hypothetical protein
VEACSMSKLPAENSSSSFQVPNLLFRLRPPFCGSCPRPVLFMLQRSHFLKG